MRPSQRRQRAPQPEHPGGPASCPRAGLLQCDSQGELWLCEAVIRGDLADWYLVRMSRLLAGHAVGDPVVLSPSEYQAFSLRRRLQAVLL